MKKFEIQENWKPMSGAIQGVINLTSLILKTLYTITREKKK